MKNTMKTQIKNSMQKKNWLVLIATSASAIVLSVTFQNCSKSNFSDSSSSSSTVAAAATSSCTGLSCGFNIDDINSLNFTGIVSGSRIGTYTLEIDTQINSASRTLSSTLKGTAVTSLTGSITLANCSASGTSVDFDAIRTNLAGVTFSSVQSPTVSKFASAQLKVILKDGTSQTFSVNTATKSVSVSGLRSIDARALVSQLESMVIKSSCSATLP